MLELGKKHKRGKKSFFYLFICYGWWLTLLGLGLLAVSWFIYFGALRASTENFLAEYSTLYINVSMLSEWLLLLGLSIILFAYLRTNIYYQKYKFILDRYAVHLHQGLFFIRETTIPYHQISNVHIERPLHYRIFGIAQLDIVTAADKNMEGTEIRTKQFLVPIIDLSIARTLSRQLLYSAGKNRPKDDSDENEEDDEETTNDSSESESDEEDESDY